jgi:hypothetical protein
MVAPMVAAAGISAVGSVLGGVTGGKGAKKQAKIAQQTQDKQIAFATGNRDYQYNLNAPTIGYGGKAEGNIAALLGLGGDTTAAGAAFDAYKGSTGYTTRLAEGLGAINNRGFAGGAGMSGATLKAGQQFGQNIASGEFGNYLGYLGGLQAAGAGARGLVAGVGNSATNQMIGAAGAGGAARMGAAGAAGDNTQAMIQNLINAGLYAYGSSYGPAKGAALPPMYNTPGM